MDQIDFTARKDPFLHTFHEPLRALNGLVPFLLMGRPLNHPISLMFSAYQIGTAGYYLYQGEKRRAILSLAHTTAATTLTLFKPVYTPLFQALCQIGTDFCEEGDLKVAARTANQTLFIVSLLVKQPEVIAASLFTQALTEFHEAYEAFSKEKKWEGASKACLALFRLIGIAEQLSEAQPIVPRDQLWQEIQGMNTGLTRAEFDAIMDYSERHTHILDAIRIKGGENGLPRSITLTPDALFIHLKAKGGMEALGEGAFKRAYVCLRIENHHAKRMAELTIRHQPQLALTEDALAKQVGSSYIAGGAEVSLFYGDKLCLIQELMDTDGWHYLKDTTATAADRLRVMEGVALGLGDLHQAGYIHCDLHHGNMLVSTNGPHTGKLSDLGLARRMSDWNPHPKRQDLRCLTYLIYQICGPVLTHCGDNPSVAELKGRCRQILTDPSDTLPSAYQLADLLRRARLALGERGNLPVPLGGTANWIASPEGFGESRLLRMLSALGFHFNTLPSPTLINGLSISTWSVMRVLGWPWAA